MTGRDVIILHNTLEQLVHPHSIEQVYTDNTTAAGIDNDTINQQKSNKMNMRYFCISDQKTSRDFLVEWKPGQENIAEYFTKHH